MQDIRGVIAIKTYLDIIRSGGNANAYPRVIILPGIVVFRVNPGGGIVYCHPGVSVAFRVDGECCGGDGDLIIGAVHREDLLSRRNNRNLVLHGLRRRQGATEHQGKRERPAS